MNDFLLPFNSIQKKMIANIYLTAWGDVNMKID